MGKNSKDKRDLYYRKAKEEGWRARSAFKLLQLDDQFHLLGGLKRVVDLCAAPGSWSQVLSKKLANDPDAKIVAVDLQPMSPIDGVVTLQADITHPKTLERIRDLFGGEPADFVCSDGAPDVTGLHDLDEYIQAQLILSALQLATALLRPGGCFVAKIFRGRDIDLMYFQLGRLFERVTCAKPRSSRGSSLEAFIVCEGYTPRSGWQPTLGKPIAVGDTLPEDDLEERAVAPFIACGDLSAYDSDATYTIDKAVKRMTLDPIQSPVAPPYKTAVEMRRKGLIRRT